MSEPRDVSRVLHLQEGEAVALLADGWTLRSGNVGSESDCVSGEYVRLVRPDGTEYRYWHCDEWQEDPILVMGAIINAASGFRPDDDGTDHYKAFGSCGLRGCTCGGQRVRS